MNKEHGRVGRTRVTQTGDVEGTVVRYSKRGCDPSEYDSGGLHVRGRSAPGGKLRVKVLGRNTGRCR